MLIGRPEIVTLTLCGFFAKEEPSDEEVLEVSSSLGYTLPNFGPAFDIRACPNNRKGGPFKMFWSVKVYFNE